MGIISIQTLQLDTLELKVSAFTKTFIPSLKQNNYTILSYNYCNNVNQTIFDFLTLILSYGPLGLVVI